MFGLVTASSSCQPVNAKGVFILWNSAGSFHYYMRLSRHSGYSLPAYCDKRIVALLHVWKQIFSSVMFDHLRFDLDSATQGSMHLHSLGLFSCSFNCRSETTTINYSGSYSSVMGGTLIRTDQSVRIYAVAKFAQKSKFPFCRPFEQKKGHWGSLRPFDWISCTGK